jgi:hypothetical protein
MCVSARALRSYDFDMKKKGKVTPRIPLLNGACCVAPSP